MTSKRTKDIRTAELIRDVNNHPHKDELIELMAQQVLEDAPRR